MKKFVFVLMPFKSDFDDIYKLGIKSACTELNFYCERVDEQYYEGNMLERIYNQINHADYLIADLSTKNPNVFYEVGYAHALNKKVVLITQNGDDIPFDMKQYLHIIYSPNNIASLKEKLQDRFKWYIDSDSIHEQINIPVDVFVNGIQLEEGKKKNININLSKEIEYSYKGYDRYNVRINLSFYNPSNKILNIEMDNCCDFILPNILPLEVYRIFEISNQRQLLKVYLNQKLYPGQWDGKSTEIEIRTEKVDINKIVNINHECEAILMQLGKLVKYPFSLTFHVENQ